MATGPFRVYGITRRGFGSSSHPADGCGIKRLAADVVAVIDSLKVRVPVLAGHSIAGREMSSLAARFPDRIGGLVYLDAVDHDPRDREANPAIRKLMKLFATPKPGSDKSVGFAALTAWWTRSFGAAVPDSELRNNYETDPGGRVGKWALTAGLRIPDYVRLIAPALAMFAVQRSARDVDAWLQTSDTVCLAALEEAYMFGNADREKLRRHFLRAQRTAVCRTRAAYCARFGGF